MRDIDDEVLADTLQPLQLAVLRLQLLHGPLQVNGGVVECSRQLAELAAAGYGEARTEVAARQLAGMRHDGGEMARDPSRQECRHQDSRQKRQGRADQNLSADLRHLALHLGIGHRQPHRAAAARRRHV